jgi:hypothetical protein
MSSLEGTGMNYPALRRMMAALPVITADPVIEKTNKYRRKGPEK